MTPESDKEIFEWPWPEGPGADHIFARQVELVNLLATRVPVFLDTNFWVWARQAAFGESDDPKLTRLLGALRMAVESGRVFFPITHDLIAEFSKQPSNLLERTMMLVDRLSLGVVMVPRHELMAIEIEHFTTRAYPGHPPKPRPLWTSYAFALGYEDLRPPGIVTDNALLVQMAEAAWMAPPSRLARNLDAAMFDARVESQRLADLLNTQAVRHADEIDGRASAVRDEVAGAASMIAGVAAREYRRIAEAAGHSTEARDIPASRSVGKRIASMVAKALEQEVNQRAFGSLYIGAMLHAAIRSEAKRKIKPNDVFDFRHATAALPHCRAFFTDGKLAALITSGHMKLDRLYDCKVVATPAEAIAVLGDLSIGADR
jgi:hypothetical protein